MYGLSQSRRPVNQVLNKITIFTQYMNKKKENKIFLKTTLLYTLCYLAIYLLQKSIALFVTIMATTSSVSLDSVSIEKEQ